MVRIRTHYNQRKTPHSRSECDSSSCLSSGDNDTEGSLADFIEHDSDERDAAQEDESYEQDEEQDEDDEDETDAEAKGEEEEEEEEDPDAAIKAQYTPDMEQLGSVITVEGVRRSTRATKGKAPTRYVDEEYADLMLEDLTAEDKAQLAAEFSSSSSEQWNDEGDDMDVDDEDE